LRACIQPPINSPRVSTELSRKLRVSQEVPTSRCVDALPPATSVVIRSGKQWEGKYLCCCMINQESTLVFFWEILHHIVYEKNIPGSNARSSLNLNCTFTAEWGEGRHSNTAGCVHSGVLASSLACDSKLPSSTITLHHIAYHHHPGSVCCLALSGLLPEYVVYL
jgi:hypothetical protein